MAENDGIENQTGMFTLAELAELNTDEIKTITTRLPTPGVYIVKGKDVKASQTQKEGKPPLSRFGFQLEVLSADPADKSVDPETLVGRVLTDSFTVWPDSLQESIGMLKGKYQKAGLPNEGKMGGVEGVEPGWLDGIVGHTFAIRVNHGESNSGTRAYFNWMTVEELEQAIAK